MYLLNVYFLVIENIICMQYFYFTWTIVTNCIRFISRITSAHRLWPHMFYVFPDPAHKDIIYQIVTLLSYFKRVTEHCICYKILIEYFIFFYYGSRDLLGILWMEYLKNILLDWTFFSFGKNSRLFYTQISNNIHISYRDEN